MGWVINATSWPLYPLVRPGFHWVGPRDHLKWCRGSRSHQDSTLDCSSCGESLYRDYAIPDPNIIIMILTHLTYLLYVLCVIEQSLFYLENSTDGFSFSVAILLLVTAYCFLRLTSFSINQANTLSSFSYFRGSSKLL